MKRKYVIVPVQNGMVAKLPFIKLGNIWQCNIPAEAMRGLQKMSCVIDEHREQVNPYIDGGGLWD